MRSFVLCFVSLSMLLGCEQPQEIRQSNGKSLESKPSPTIAYIGGREITLRDFDSWKSNMKYLRRKLPVRRAKMLLDGFLKHHMLIEAARKNGFDAAPEVIKAMEDAMVRVFLKKELYDRIRSKKPTAQEIHQFYRDNIKIFMRPERRKVSLIYISCKMEKKQSSLCKDNIFSLYRRLKKGTSFSFLAKNYSEDIFSRNNGGNIGFIFPPGDKRTRARLDRIVIKTAYKIKNVGNVSKPVRGRDGFFIIKLSGLLRRDVFPFESQRSKARSLLLKKRRISMTKHFFSRLKKDFRIRILEKEFNSLIRR